MARTKNQPRRKGRSTDILKRLARIAPVFTSGFSSTGFSTCFPVFEVPVPADAAPIEEDDGEYLDQLQSSWRSGINEMKTGHQICGERPVACVLVKHWEPGTRPWIGPQGVSQSKTEAAAFVNHFDFPVHRNLLTLAVVPLDKLQGRRFDLQMGTCSMPAIVVHLLRANILKLMYVPTRDAVQFILPVGRQKISNMQATQLSLLITWLHQMKHGPAGCTSSEKPADNTELVLEKVRRRPTDGDVQEYEPYLRAVRSNTELRVTLRPYQERAVAWMLSRELGPSIELIEDVVWEASQDFVRDCPLKSFDGCTVVSKARVNIFYGSVLDCDDIEDLSDENRGGLLCDEMGLGKTVELMQLVLCNKLPEVHCTQPLPVDDGEECLVCTQSVGRHRWTCMECNGVSHRSCIVDTVTAEKQGYICMNCAIHVSKLCDKDTKLRELPHARATLVVIPTTLLLQWKEELSRHVRDALNIEVFHGVRYGGYVSQRRLLQADVVLTTYDALRADIAAFKALRNPPSALRHPRRYRPTPIPLLSVRWHRLALDESQMLGGGSSQVAEMAAYLQATYRWCVTGTPISRSLSDAIPMLDMLHLRSAGHAMDWAAVCNRMGMFAVDRNLRRVLRKVMWRSCKADVEKEELKLPPQTVQFVRTEFGPIEKYNYGKLEEIVRESSSRARTSGNSSAHQISHDLLTMLRQACNHPQIGTSGRRLLSRAARQALSRTVKNNEDAAVNAAKRAERPLNLGEVLHALVSRARLEAEDSLRTLIATSNGLAAICWLQYSMLPALSTDVSGLITAVTLYRNSIAVAEENQKLTRWDKIQKMHVLHNLSEALSEVRTARKRFSDCSGRSSSLDALKALGSTVRDGNLNDEVEELKRNYVSEASAQLNSAMLMYNTYDNELGKTPLLDPDDNYNTESCESGNGIKDDEEVGVDDDVSGLLDNDAIDAAFTSKFNLSNCGWWNYALAIIMEKDKDTISSFIARTVQKILDSFPGKESNGRSLAPRLNKLRRFVVVIESEITKFHSARNELRKVLGSLPGAVPPTPMDVAISGQCRTCREYRNGKPCKHCSSEHLFKEVERYLYYVVEDDHPKTSSRSRNGDADRFHGSGVDASDIVKGMFNSKLKKCGATGQCIQGELEIAMKCLAPYIRSTNDDKLIKEMDAWFSNLETLKKEHMEARRLFEAQRSLLARMDEVNMALMRMSVLNEGETVGTLRKDEQMHRLPRESLPVLNVELTNEKAVAQSDFRNKRSSLVYLLSLKEDAVECSMSEKSSNTGRGENDGTCTICMTEYDELDSKAAVFVCGHIFCHECTLALIRKSNNRNHVKVLSILCPTCRVRCAVDEINFVGRKIISDPEVNEESDSGTEGTTKRKWYTNRSRRPNKMLRMSQPVSTFHENSVSVFGSHGTKFSAIIRTLRGIWQQHINAKVLIFSEWVEVLSLLGYALDTNNVAYVNGARASSSLEFANRVTNFKRSDTYNVLLLPLKKGGAGLNLVEATHVILVEPSLDLAQAEQAVGRVHRIGQQRPTYVHRMVVHGTIEDAVIEVGEETKESIAGSSSTKSDIVMDELMIMFESEQNIEGDTQSQAVEE